jgi:hypothetical protein
LKQSRAARNSGAIFFQHAAVPHLCRNPANSVV